MTETPDLNELQHIIQLALGRLDLIQSEGGDEDGNPVTQWEWDAVAKAQAWADSLSKMGTDDVALLALSTLEEHGFEPRELVWDGQMEKVLTISTCHIEKATAIELNEIGSGIGLTLYDKGDVGWWIFVATDEDDWPPLPGDLHACMAMARSLGCDWLCLDRDAAPHPLLATYEW